MYRKRLERLAQTMMGEEWDIIALNPSPSLYYLTGLSFHLIERPIIWLFAPDEQPIFIIPELELPKAETSGLSFEPYSYGEDEASREQAFHKVAERLHLNEKRVGIEPLRFRVFELRLLEKAAPRATFSSAETIFTKLRIIKDEKEINAIRGAVEIAEEALKATLPLIRIGMTELEVASELTFQLLRAGSQPEIPFSPIAAAGPNSALPHATPSDRTLQAGDLLVLDFGATCSGYISDLTRTFAIGEYDDETAKIHNIVCQANAAGRDAIRPGIACQELDRAARAVIEGDGYGQYFIHRTGHGFGLEAHEPPSIREGNELALAQGMTFTIEPGIYLPGRGGVRVEDNMVVTQDGGESFSTYPRQIEVIG